MANQKDVEAAIQEYVQKHPELVAADTNSAKGRTNDFTYELEKLANVTATLTESPTKEKENYIFHGTFKATMKEKKEGAGTSKYTGNFIEENFDFSATATVIPNTLNEPVVKEITNIFVKKRS